MLFNSCTIPAELIVSVVGEKSENTHWQLHYVERKIGSYTAITPSWEASASHLLRNLLGTSVHGYGVYFTEWGRYNHLKHQLAYIQVWYNNR